MASTRAPDRPRCANSSVATASICSREVAAAPRRSDWRLDLPDFALAFPAITDSTLILVMPTQLCPPAAPAGQNLTEARSRPRERSVRGPVHVHAKRLGPFGRHGDEVRKYVARHRELVDERYPAALLRHRTGALRKTHRAKEDGLAPALPQELVHHPAMGSIRLEADQI